MGTGETNGYPSDVQENTKTGLRFIELFKCQEIEQADRT